MLRKIGRISLIFIGLGMLAYTAYNIYIDFQQIAAHGGWGNLFKDLPFATSMILNLIWQVVWVFTGLSAFLAGLGGHCGLWFIIFIAVMIGIFVWDSINKIRANNLNVMNFTISIAFQIAYIAGFVIFRIGLHQEKKTYKKAVAAYKQQERRKKKEN